MAGGDSSDLAASDHMLEVEAGTPRVLPPQQEQVSAAAPTSLTVGCIIGIVFGVLMSLVILVGKLWREVCLFYCVFILRKVFRTLLVKNAIGNKRL